MISELRCALGRTAARALLPLALLSALVGCNTLDDALKVDTPSQIPAEGLAVPANAQLLVEGAIGDFECAIGSYIVETGIVSQELVDATQTASRWAADKRDIHPGDSYGTSSCEGLGVYTPLATARYSADQILTNLQGWTDDQVANRQDLIAQAAAYAGYSYLLLGEGFCTMAIDLSPEMTDAEVFAKAEERFTTAIEAAKAAGDNDILNMAYVGRARTRLDLGNTAGAEADAKLVPPDFVKVATASNSNSRRRNRVYEQGGVGSTYGQAVSVGPTYRNVTFDGVADPRVPVLDAHDVATEGTPIFIQQKYNDITDPLPIATGTEAQLIIAEVEGGQTAVDIINDLHRAAGLPLFESTDPTAIQTQVIEERRRELWLQGNRFYDIRRFNLPLDPAPGTEYHKGGVYGDTRCFPLPDVERLNNPNIGG